MSTPIEGAPVPIEQSMIESTTSQSWLNRLPLNARQIVGRAALALGLASGLLVVDAGLAEQRPAYADITTNLEFTNTYPYSDAKERPDGDFWVDENGDGSFDAGEQYSPYTYVYRNCVDGAAYWAKKYFNKDATGWSHAYNWDEKAAAADYAVKSGNSKNIEIGDIAQSNDGTYGHVGFVTAVTKDNAGNVVKIRVAELNKGDDGNFTHEWYDTKNASGNFVRSPSGRDWENFLDLDGAGTSAPSAAARQDLAWWTGDILNTRPNPGFEISSATDGLAPPYWADVMDYDGDGLDDIVLFRENGGDIKIIRKNPSGGWSPVSGAVRGPNIAPPLWAATADLDGNGKRNDLIWWSTNGISKLVGEDLNTKSTTTGIAAPEWADEIDYNQDGRDDIVLYRPDGSLRVLLNSSSGGWTVAAPNPVRTGLSAPVWAGVGDFDGDGKARELAWWDVNGNVSILNGENRFAHMSTTEDVTPPEWADITDYDGDGKDDIVFFRRGDGTNGTINILRKRPTTAGFYLHTQNPIRGPGVSAPSWAKVGKFTK